MKFKIIQFSFALLLITLGFSCKKYLDVKQYNTEVLLTTAKQCQMLMDNYIVFNSNYPSDGELSAGDFYLDDAAYNDDQLWGITPEDQIVYNWQPGAIRSGGRFQYTPCYNVIYNANLVLEAVAKISNAAQDTINNIKGQALFFRAYALWNVAKLYTKPYHPATASQDPGMPIRLSSDINGKSVRGTVQQTYDQITSDLKQAAALMVNTSTIASRPDKAAAHAMLARVYLSMSNYQDALSNANACLQISNSLMDYNTLDTTSFTPFFPRFNKEVIFQSVGVKAPMLQPGSGYGTSALIPLDLLASYQMNDLRRKVFFKENISSDDYSTPNGTYYFVGNYDPTGIYGNNTFFNGLATDEMYLIRAEAYARAGNTNAAMADLNTLLKTRWATGTYTPKTASNADDALKQILTERRKELLMRDLRWTDLRRLNTDPRFAVTLSRTVEGKTYTLPPNDPRYTLLIPQEVITLSGIAQNAR